MTIYIKRHESKYFKELYLDIINKEQFSIERKTEELEMMKLENSLKQERQNSIKIKNKYDALKVANEVLQRRVASLEKENKFLEIKLRVKQEEVADFVTYNKPLEKAYKSLQRRYVKVSDELDISRRY